jgi:ribose transport system substrate-binding protein
MTSPKNPVLARLLMATALLLGLAALVAGCGSSGSSSGSSSSSEASTTESSESEATETGEASGGEAEGGAQTTAAAKSDEGSGFKLGFVSALDCSNALVCAQQEAFVAEAKALGAEPVVLEAAVSDLVNNQISNMDQLISEGMDAIAIWPQDESALKQPIKRAAEAGIPVFGTELYEPEGQELVTDIVQGRSLTGKQMAETACEKEPAGGGDVLFGNFAGPNPGLAVMLKYFEEELKECGPSIKKVEFLNETDDVAGSRPKAEAAFQSAKNPFAVAGYNDPTAMGASLAAEQLGIREKLWIMGYNLGEDGVEALESGRIDESWDFRATTIGQLLAKMMVEYLGGANKQPAKIVMAWPKCYTQETIGEHTSTPEDIEAIEAGEDLAEKFPELLAEGSTIPDPPSDIPNCKA